MFCQREAHLKCAAIKWGKRGEQSRDRERERERSAHASANLLDCHEPELEKFHLTVIGDNGVWPTELSSPIFINAEKTSARRCELLRPYLKIEKSPWIQTANDSPMKLLMCCCYFCGCCYLLPHFIHRSKRISNAFFFLLSFSFTLQLKYNQILPESN